jgi:SAM-dependent methyltransferase
MEHIERIKNKYNLINFNRNKLTSEELYEEINKSDWEYYQYLRTIIHEEQKKKGGSKLTYEVINEELGDFKGIIADFGCAKNELAKLRKNNKVYGFDFYAVDDSVIECCLTKVPLSNNEIDVVVISLALSTTDYHKVLEEAYRVLKNGGLLKLVLFLSNTSKTNDIINKHFPNIGFSIDKKTIRENLIYIDAYKNEKHRNK